MGNTEKLAKAIETHAGFDRIGAGELAHMIVTGQQQFTALASDLEEEIYLWLKLKRERES